MSPYCWSEVILSPEIWACQVKLTVCLLPSASFTERSVQSCYQTLSNKTNKPISLNVKLFCSLSLLFALYFIFCICSSSHAPLSQRYTDTQTSQWTCLLYQNHRIFCVAAKLYLLTLLPYNNVHMWVWKSLLYILIPNTCNLPIEDGLGISMSKKNKKTNANTKMTANGKWLSG